LATTSDATLQDLGRESPRGFLTNFDQPPTLLNVDLAARHPLHYRNILL